MLAPSRSSWVAACCMVVPAKTVAALPTPVVAVRVKAAPKAQVVVKVKVKASAKVRVVPLRALPAVAADQASRSSMKKPGLGRVFCD